MTTIMEILRIVSVVCSGVCAGALWTIMVVAIPMAHRLAPGESLVARQNIDPLMDRFNPICVALSGLAGAAILIVHHDLSHAAGVLTALGVIGMLGVMALSLGVIAPITRTLRGWSPDSISPELDSTTRRWESMHRMRTFLALAAFVAFAIAAVVG